MSYDRLDGLTASEKRSIAAVYAGEATPDQQKECIAVIVKKIAATHQNPFVPGSDRESSFLSGRIFVGQKITHYALNSPEKETKND